MAHGCTDFSLNMDSTKYSSRPISGGGIGDIWKGRLLDGTPVAIKVWRPNSLIQENPNCKQLKVSGDSLCIATLIYSLTGIFKQISVQCGRYTIGRKQSMKIYKN